MAVTIRGKTLPLPILQGGMGVGISLDRLAGAVAAAGGMGTISTAVCGFREPDFAADPKGANLRALAAQVRRARELARGAGMVAINAMVATTQYADSIRTALRAADSPYAPLLDALVATLPEPDEKTIEGFRKLISEGPPTELVGVGDLSATPFPTSDSTMGR